MFRCCIQTANTGCHIHNRLLIPYNELRCSQSIHEDATIKQVCSLLVSSESSITLQFERSEDLQLNGNDCGLFAQAFCTALCVGKDQQGLRFDQNTMSQHLFRCRRAHEAIPMQRHYPNGNCKDLPNSHLLHLLYPRSRQHGGINTNGAENGTIKNTLGCQSMLRIKEAFHESAETAVNSSQHVCIDLLHKPT